MNAPRPLPDAAVLEVLRLTPRSWWWSALRWLLALALLAAAGGGGWWLWNWWSTPAPTRYAKAAVRRGRLVITVTATGALEPINQVEVGCEVSGRIAKVLVDYNDPVVEKQPLLEIDTEELGAQAERSRSALRSAQADLKEAEASQLEARQKLRRLQRLRETNRITSEEEIETAEAVLARAEAHIARANAQIAMAQATLTGDESKLKKARVYSPISGIVLTRRVEPGQTVAATFQTPVLLTLAEDLRRMRLHVDIDEADVGHVRQGQRASFTVDAFPDREFPARIVSLRYYPKRAQDVVTYEAVLDVANDELLLRPGMTAVAEIVVAERDNAVLAPNAALRFTPPALEEQEREADDATAPAPRVWRLVNGQPTRIDPRVGLSDGRHTEVLDDSLRPGDELLTETLK